MLLRLVAFSDKSQFRHSVVSLKDMGVTGDRLTNLKTYVKAIQMSPALSDADTIGRLARELSQLRPDIVQTWMYHSDLVGGSANLADSNSVFARDAQTNRYTTSTVKPPAIRVSKLGSKLCDANSQFIVCCSDEAKQWHTSIGYDPRFVRVIPNGFDTERYKSDVMARLKVREQLEIQPDAVVIGHVGRYHPMKNHRGLIAAAGVFSKSNRNVEWILCGDGVDEDNATLWHAIHEARLTKRVHLLGLWNDMPEIYNAMDIFTMCSMDGEGFPCVVGEAMSCGIPCVVTDVGDTKYLVGDTGVVIRPGDSAELVAAWQSILKMEPSTRQSLGTKARDQIRSCYEIRYVVGLYENLYEEIAAS